MHRGIAGERARTVLRTSPTLEVVADGIREFVAEHGADQRGRPLLMLPASSPVVAAARSATLGVRLRAASLRLVEVADRVRARLELHGHLRALRVLRSGRVLLATEVLAVRLDGSAVDPDTYADSRPDPFADDEAALVRALLRHRPATLAGACAQVVPDLVATAVAIAPSGLDRHGVTVWLAGPGWSREIRLGFPAPLDANGDIAAAVRTLLREAARPRAAGQPGSH